MADLVGGEPGDTQLPVTPSDSPRPPLTFTADQLEEIFHEAIRRGDTRGVEDSLRVMVTVDPQRAVALYDSLKTAVAVAQVIRR